MKKYICGIIALFLLAIGMPTYAECNHQYEKEYNYSTEVEKVMDKHCYRMKCTVCGEIQVSSQIKYENCLYSNSVCLLCGEKRNIMPEYNINLSKENQTYLYQMCVKYGEVNSYRTFIALIYKNSNFNEKLENGVNKGLFQLNEAHDYSWLIGRNEYDLLNAKDNLEIGVALYKFYSKLPNCYKGNLIIAMTSGMVSNDMREYKTETGYESNVDILLKVFDLEEKLELNGSLN